MWKVSQAYGVAGKLVEVVKGFQECKAYVQVGREVFQMKVGMKLGCVMPQRVFEYIT